MPSSSVSLLSISTVHPDKASSTRDLKLSVSDLPMLSCHYIQKGCLFTRPLLSSSDSLISLIKNALSSTLSLFPPLAGRLITDSDGYVNIACNDEGAEFVHARAPHVRIVDILSPVHVPEEVKELFPMGGIVSYDGHFKPILSVQVTELDDGIFIACGVNHAVTDGTSFWNFFNTFAANSRGAKGLPTPPDFRRDSVLISPAVLQVPAGGPKITFSANAPLKERIFRFSRESILKLKSKVNNQKLIQDNETIYEIIGKSLNDKTKIVSECTKTIEISSFQSLCALLWRGITRARKLPSNKTTTFRMAVNCRHRLEPKLESFYFGNAIQSIPMYATASEVVSRDLRWCAEKLNKNVVAHDDSRVRQVVEDWERDPRCFPLGNFDGAMITMGSSPRFPMYDNDFGWGRPVAIRSGRANKFDGKISAFPGREMGGSVDLEVVLCPETMTGLEADTEFMQYVSES